MEWRVAHNYPLYEINRRGDVREINTGRRLQSSWNRHGHHYHLVKGNRVVAVHRDTLIAMTFPKKEEV